jgi:hypothetical protein
MATLIAVYNSEGCVGRCDDATNSNEGKLSLRVEMKFYNPHEPLAVKSIEEL